MAVTRQSQPHLLSTTCGLDFADSTVSRLKAAARSVAHFSLYSYAEWNFTLLAHWIKGSELAGDPRGLKVSSEEVESCLQSVMLNSEIKPREAEHCPPRNSIINGTLIKWFASMIFPIPSGQDPCPMRSMPTGGRSKIGLEFWYGKVSCPPPLSHLDVNRYRLQRVGWDVTLAGVLCTNSLEGNSIASPPDGTSWQLKYINQI